MSHVLSDMLSKSKRAARPSSLMYRPTKRSAVPISGLVLNTLFVDLARRF